MKSIKDEIFVKGYDSMWFKCHFQIGTECTLHILDCLNYPLEDHLYGTIGEAIRHQLGEDHANN